MKLNVSDLINFDTVEKFKIYSYFAFVTSIFALCFYAFLVIQCSNKKMKTFRILMLAYIFISLLAEVSFFLLKPFQLFPYNIIYPVGPLAPTSSTTAGIGVTFTLSLYIPLVDILIVMVTERHFQIVSVYAAPNKMLHRKLIYSTMLGSTILTLGFLVNFTLKSNDDSQAMTILTQNVKNVHILLDLQPSLSMIQNELNADALIALSVTLINALYRVILCLWLVSENLKYGRNTVISLSKHTKRQFALMLQSTLVQGAVAGSVGASGGLWLLMFLIPNLNYPTISLLAAGVAVLYPVVDVIAVTLMVKPYRELAKSIITLQFSFKKQNFGN